MSALLTEQQRRVLADVLGRFAPPVQRVDVHGSRANGTARPGSDVDLVLAGPLDASALSRASAALAESYLSIGADLSAYALLADGPFRDRVLATAVPLFDAAALVRARAAGNDLTVTGDTA